MPPPYTQFAGKPDPWPGDVALQPNEALLAAYTARYGQAPGNPSNDDLHKWIPGFSNEMHFVNGVALANYYASIGTPRTPTYTETMDCAFGERKGNPFYRTFWWEMQEGGTAANPVHVNDAARPHGPFTQAGPAGYTQYLYNDHVATAPPPTPDPVPTPDPAPDPLPAPAVPEALITEAKLIASWPGPPWSGGRVARVRKFIAAFLAFAGRS